MAKLKAEVYKKENTQTCDELLEELLDACQELDFVCRANIPLSKAKTRVGYGVSEKKKCTACDGVIEIVKKIKKINAW